MRHRQIETGSRELRKILDVRVAAHEHPRGQVPEGGVHGSFDRASDLGLPFELYYRPAHLRQLAEHVAVDLVFTAFRCSQRSGAVVGGLQLLEHRLVGLEWAIDMAVEHAERQRNAVRDSIGEIGRELAEIRGFWPHRDSGILDPQLAQWDRRNPIEPQA